MSSFAAGFLSYARIDDDRESGRISRLREAIRAEFSIITGQELEIFIDRDGIQWGDPFRRRLEEALEATTFFIPILTPTYFQREECRKEMQKFVASARELGLEDLLLSIRYVPVPDMTEDSPDELKAIAASMQYEDLSDLRFEEESSATYRKRVHELASRLVDLTHRLENRPAERGSSTESSSSSASEEDDDTPGLMDSLADLQPAAEAWSATMLALPETLAPFNQAFTNGAEQMTAAGSAKNPFAARVLIARKLAEDLEAPLGRIETLSKEYFSTLLRIDPAIGAFIESAALIRKEADRDVESVEDGDLDSAIDSLRELIANSRSMYESVERATMAAQGASKISRDLRPSLRRFQEAMRNISDGQEFINDWEQRMDSLEL